MFSILLCFILSQLILNNLSTSYNLCSTHKTYQLTSAFCNFNLFPFSFFFSCLLFLSYCYQQISDCYQHLSCFIVKWNYIKKTSYSLNLWTKHSSWPLLVPDSLSGPTCRRRLTSLKLGLGLHFNKFDNLPAAPALTVQLFQHLNYRWDSLTAMTLR